MRLLAILGLVAIAAAPAPEEANTVVKPVCQNSDIRKVEQQQSPPGVHKLTAEPPAKQILGVLRTVDGCTQAVVIREEVGEPARR